MIPLLHDFTGETVLVFGGGPVGARKARRFAREARVVVVSPEFADERFEPVSGNDPNDGGETAITGHVERVRASPAPDDVASWFDRTDPVLAVAATDDADLNRAVAREARERDVLVNRADTSGTDARPFGEVVVPATVRDDPVVASVATGGASPALSKHLRERLEAELMNAGAMAELTAEIRANLKERGVSPATRRRAVRQVVRDSNVWKALGTGRANARRRATEVVSDVAGDEQ